MCYTNKAKKWCIIFSEQIYSIAYDCIVWYNEALHGVLRTNHTFHFFSTVLFDHD